MDKVAIILQPFGCGDVIFAMGVAENFREQGYKTLWPVKPWFVEGLNRAYPNVTFVPDDIFEPNLFLLKDVNSFLGSMKIVPIRWSDAILGQPSKLWMRTKYDLYNLDYTKWKTHAYYKRYPEKEYAIMDDFNLQPGEKFNLIATTFRSNFGGVVPINVNNGYRNIEMTVMPGYSLFDWSFLIERATTIHAVNSAIFYLIELLSCQAEEIHLYSRVPDEIGFPYTDYLMTKNYILHQ